MEIVIRLIDRYMLTRVAMPLLAAVFIALAALLMERLIRLLDLFANKGGPILLILQMLVNLIPHYLALALPMALFIGAMYSVMRLSSDSELDALRGGGLSLYRLAVPIMGLAVLLAGFNFYLMGYLQPYTRYSYRALVYLVTETAWDTALERGSFFNGFDGKTILIGNISNGGNVLSQIFIYEGDKQKEIVTTAEAGALVRDPANFSLRLHLTEGVRLESTGTNVRPVRFSELDLPLYSHSPGSFRNRGDKESELDFTELLKAKSGNYEGYDANDIEAEIHQRIVRSLSVLFLPLLAFPVGISSKRSARTMRILIGMALLIAYYQVIEFGQTMVEDNRIDVILALWVPFGIFASFNTWLFYICNKRPGQDSLAFIFDGLDRLKLILWTLFGQRQPESQ